MTAPTLAELLAESIAFPDDVFAPQIEQPDPFGWSDDSDVAEPAALPGSLHIVPKRTPANCAEGRHVYRFVRSGPDGTDDGALYRCEDCGSTDPEGDSAPAPKRTLRDRVACVEFIAETIEQLDDETLTDDARAALSKLLIAELAGTRAKVDAVSAALAMFESLEAAATAERERLDARAKRFARQARSLGDYVLATLEASKLERLEGETSTLARRLNPPSVVIDDPTRLTHEFLAYPEAPPPRPDKDAIKRALKAKRAVPGCRLAQTARLVRS